MAYPSEPLVPS